MAVLVGTSGWQYRDWRGVLYPERLAQRRWLEHYGRRFATVENNGTFYRLPKAETFDSWRSQLPEGFSMAIKASRFLTHIKRLRDPAEPVERLMDVARRLGDRLGPVLMQLPPNLKADPGLLADCLDLFPSEVRVAVEPRDRSWWTDEVASVLSDHDAALCWADTRSRTETPLWRTASWGYLRLHEGTADPAPEYGDRALRSWCERLNRTWGEREDVHVYFNNDSGGAAVRNAFRFAELMRRTGAEVVSAQNR
ncbi:DUF72 domain-containing protein [Glycomyces xiaoerkulensis]|uniref:DUF72 domain-containing protein n=1 Tax=Glycomyces xiaoerkulensis TaxID=2038139 RepID=UPI000C255DCB|nr:DUF72 domain-containing protein [Glycomyces xiaoerkulensis]